MTTKGLQETVDEYVEVARQNGQLSVITDIMEWLQDWQDNAVPIDDLLEYLENEMENIKCQIN